MRFFTDFKGLGTEDARQGEHLVAVIHHHWFALLREMLGVALLFVAPFIAIPVIGSFFAAGATAAQTGAIVAFLGAIWALICWSILFSRWTDFYFDVWVITNWRIIDMDLQGLFKIDIATLMDLDHIQDITTHSNGVIENVLNFGDIAIQTSATKREFLFVDAPAPRKIERLIRDAQEELMKLKVTHGLHSA